MKTLEPSIPQIFQHLKFLSASVMQPAKSESRKKQQAISEALQALKSASTTQTAQVEKKHLKQLGVVCDLDGKIRSIAIGPIQHYLQHYRKKAWKFDPKGL